MNNLNCLSSKKYFTLIILWMFSYLGLNAQSTVRISQDNVTFRKCSSLKCPSIGILNESEGGKLIKTENEETIDGYGTHPWYQVIIGKDTGFVFGGLIEIIPNESKEILLNIDGSVGGTIVNIRNCGSLECDIVTTLYKGDKLKVISKTPYRDKIGSAWTNWYRVVYQGFEGYIYGSLLITDDLTVLYLIKDSKIYDQPNGQITHSFRKGQNLDILTEGESSVIHPFGRHYWYEVALTEKDKGWIFGGVTSAASKPVDCQCVDFVKHQLKISGPTKNAHEWDEVLLGMITVIKDDIKQNLSYVEIKDSTFQDGDIIIFDNNHSQAHDLYGHIGIYKDKRVVNNKTEILIEGGNHPDKEKEYYTKSRCNNISEKWYILDEYVKAFRPK
jgi:hypothetical protein